MGVSEPKKHENVQQRVVAAPGLLLSCLRLIHRWLRPTTMRCLLKVNFIEGKTHTYWLQYSVVFFCFFVFSICKYHACSGPHSLQNVFALGKQKYFLLSKCLIVSTLVFTPPDLVSALTQKSIWKPHYITILWYFIAIFAYGLNVLVQKLLVKNSGYSHFHHIPAQNQSKKDNLCSLCNKTSSL